MKASEFIAELSKQISEHDDVDLVVCNYIGHYEPFTTDNIGILETKHGNFPRVYQIIIDTKEKK